MDLQFLRTATRREHEATEAAMPLLGPDLSPARYASVLRTLLFVVGGWEDWAAAHAPGHLLPLLAARRRGPLLRADLDFLARFRDAAAPEVSPSQEDATTLGAANAATAAFGDWVPVVLEGGESLDSVAPDTLEAGFLGALYVIEGSTLGGRFLAREVAQNLGLTAGVGNAYFEGHGEATGALWRAVTAKIAAVPDAQAERLVRSAKRTFAVFETALLRQHSLPDTANRLTAPKKLQGERVPVPARSLNEASKIA